MSDPQQNLIWIDLEMTGLDPEHDSILEIATVVTDRALNVLSEGPSLAIFHPPEKLAAMDEWNTTHHTESGLLQRVRNSRLTLADAEKLTLDFLSRHTLPDSSPMCGNSICQDRRFLNRYMPLLDRYFNYRHLDVTSLKILARAWSPKVATGFTKQSRHRALDDIYESIAELRYYREHFLRID